jgi:hypothetical protein
MCLRDDVVRNDNNNIYRAAAVVVVVVAFVFVRPKDDAQAVPAGL